MAKARGHPGEAVQKVAKTCPNCRHRFEHRAYQRSVSCPKCHGRLGRDTDRHTGAGVFIRMSEAEKDALERMSFETGRSQADLLREATADFLKKRGRRWPTPSG